MNIYQIARLIPRKMVYSIMGSAAIFGIIVISLFVFGVDNPDPSWGKYWRIKPLIITPIICAFSSLIFLSAYILDPKTQGMKITIYFLSMLIFLFGTWVGVVLGLNGTMWN